MNKVYLMDCMQGMRGTPDKYYDLAVVDPPYGISINMNMGRRKNKKAMHQSKDWDNQTPDDIYFNELMRVSKNQIIWGGNYFNLPLVGGWLFWDKLMPEGLSFSMGELAWMSIGNTVRKVELRHPAGNKKIHPTQKPIALYDWIFAKYATKGMKILDTHAGSMSSVISAMKNEMQITAYEIDSDYFNAGKKRIENYLMQGDMFQQPKIEFIP